MTFYPDTGNCTGMSTVINTDNTCKAVPFDSSTTLYARVFGIVGSAGVKPQVGASATVALMAATALAVTLI